MRAALSLVALVGAYDTSPFSTPETPYPQKLSDSDNLLKYFANTGPYVDRPSYGINRDPPTGCIVDQVVMLARHGERWPSKKVWHHQSKVIDKIQKLGSKLKGSLAFAKDWEPYAYEGDGWLREESLTGPYSGLLDAYYHGIQYRRRYGHIYNPEDQLPLFFSAYQRDADTGRKFGEGFLNWNYTEKAAVNYILEENGANSLSTSCKLANSSIKQSVCPEFSYYDEFHTAAKRLNKESPGLELTAKEIKYLMDVTAYEFNIRGSSPWAKVFNSEEWVAYEYYVTSTIYCGRGPGSYTSPIIGSLFLNATRQLLSQGPEKSKLPLAFSFAHDSDIIPVVAAMNIDTPQNISSWDPTEVRFDQRYDASNLVPMGARLVFERLSCTKDIDEPAYFREFPLAFNVSRELGNKTENYSNSSKLLDNSTNSTNSTNANQKAASNTETYVRVVLNEAVVPIDGYSNGPGKSTKLSDFEKWVDDRLTGINYSKQCELKSNQPKELTFFWDWSNSTKYNAEPKYEPAQAGELNTSGVPI